MPENNKSSIPESIARKKITTIQINLGNLCNQSCSHCHIAASPAGKNNMSADVAQKVMSKLVDTEINYIEFTGGAPEMNPNLKEFIEFLSSAKKTITVRTNLTILNEPDYEHFIELYRKHKVKLVASLPQVAARPTDDQRGSGVFAESIKALKKLNKQGYGKPENYSLKLDIATNPVDDTIPLPQKQLEEYFRYKLNQQYGIQFNSLISMTNTPVTRYKAYLKKQGSYDAYMQTLKNHFNKDTLDGLMCRSLVSVDYQGRVYDCDFSLAEKNTIQGHEESFFWDIDFTNFNTPATRYEYCYACTANEGSSCYGSLSYSAAASSVTPVQEIETETLDFQKNAVQYYGEAIQQTSDLVTAACCDPGTLPDYIKPVLSMIENEITEKYYGCGSPLPVALTGQKLLDVGCGTGRDVFLASNLVSETGFCTGIDMTENQIQVARKHTELMTRKFGYSQPNVKFIHDKIESIQDHFENESLDIVISNCVMNLVREKELAFKQIFDSLKYGGELYFSDIYADRRLPDYVMNHPVLHGECLGGAMYINDFIRLARKTGFLDPRVMTIAEIKIDNPEILQLTRAARFYSITYRLFKLKDIEDKCEDYGHIAIYKGGLYEMPFAFSLDDSHVFEVGKPERVCGNTAKMLYETRFAPYFEIIGSFDTHFGEFDGCATTAAANTSEDSSPADCGC